MKELISKTGKEQDMSEESLQSDLDQSEPELIVELDEPFEFGSDLD